MHSRLDSGKHGGKQKSETNIAVTLVLISTIFVVTTLPYIIGWSWYSFVESKNFPNLSPLDQERVWALLHMCSLSKNVNYAVNFFVYSTKFDFFWTTLLVLFRIKDKTEQARFLKTTVRQ